MLNSLPKSKKQIAETVKWFTKNKIVSLKRKTVDQSPKTDGLNWEMADQNQQTEC